MKVFISWSGEKSRLVATGLKAFFMGVLASKYERNAAIQELKSKVDTWETTMKQDA
jgi:hypothetical protein